MASFDRDGGKNITRRYSGENGGKGGGDEGMENGQRRNSASILIENLRRESAAIAALRNVQRELNRAPSPNREGYSRNSLDHFRKIQQPTGYYVPPPGYADPLRDNLEDEGNLKLEQPISQDFPTERSRIGRWSGPYNDRREWHNYPDQIRYHRGNDWHDQQPNKFSSHHPFHSDRHKKKFMPTLSHHDWSVPQAKQILSHWATLATLLGGVQATLLAYYSKQEQTGSGEEDPVYRMVIAISCSGLFLEVYGALLAAGTIVASISLQAKNSQSNANFGVGSNQQTDRETLLNNGMFSFNGINPSQQSSSSGSCLSPRASAILDRLTVLVGFLIPLGAVFELIGLAGYTAHYLGNSVAITMVLTLIIAILVTIAAGFLGIQAGNRAMRNQCNNT